MIWSAVIDRYCKRENISQEEFAKRVGVTRSTVQRWMSGKTKPCKSHERRMDALFHAAPLAKYHTIKIRRDFADAVVAGDKTFEVRKNDRDYKVGDVIVFYAVSKATGKFVRHKINRYVFEITYVLTGWGLMDGYCVFGIVPTRVLRS